MFLLFSSLFPSLFLQASSILVIDPATGAVGTIDFDTLGDANTPRWAGGVLDPGTGKIFAIPDRANVILVFDPATNATDLATIRSPRLSSGAFVSRAVAGPLAQAPSLPHSLPLPCPFPGIVLLHVNVPCTDHHTPLQYGSN